MTGDTLIDSMENIEQRTPCGVPIVVIVTCVPIVVMGVCCHSNVWSYHVVIVTCVPIVVIVVCSCRCHSNVCSYRCHSNMCSYGCRRMDFRNRRHERGSNWTDPEIVELLQLWSDEAVQVELESSLRNQRVFDRIANVLLEKGIYRSGDQCREKIKKMKLEYRRIKDNLKMRSWRFYDVMDRVLANRPSVTYSSLGGSVVAQQVFQMPPGAESYLHTGGHQEASSFAPVTSGGFLFGQPTGSGDLLDVKCEDVEDGGGLDLGVAPPVPAYEISGDEPETEHSGLDPERGPEPEGGPELGQGDASVTTAVSPSGGGFKSHVSV